jgi:hypothetical protein
LIDTPIDRPINAPPYGQHLYIAIAKTSGGKYLFVNVTSRREGSETTCILLPSPDVPSFIVHESVIVYRRAEEMDATKLSQLITPGSPIPKGFCSPAILSQIQQGGVNSRRLAKKYKTILKQLLGII